MVILWQDCYGKGNLRKSYCNTVGRRFPIGNAYSYTVKKGYSYLYVDDIKLTGKKQNIDPMWKVLNKEDDLGEPTSFLYHVYLGCKHNTSNDMFSRCKSVQKMATGKSDDQFIQRENKLKLGTS